MVSSNGRLQTSMGIANDDRYPRQVCNHCAHELGAKPRFAATTYRMGTCGLCDQEQSVVIFSQFNWPDLRMVRQIRRNMGLLETKS